MAGPAKQAKDTFLERLKGGRLPDALTSLDLASAGLSAVDLVQLFESQATSRLLDHASRSLAASGETFYSIGSSGHEGNAALARGFRKTDLAFLHYRSGAFFLERARKEPGSTPIWDIALSFSASAEDPISGGRHKVIGSKPLFIPPQTSTIASHLPKAVGAAFSIPLARTLKSFDSVLDRDGIVLCSFGDASANHSTAQGAFNAASWMAFRNLPLPVVFVCEDNGIGISVSTPASWIKASFENRPGLHYVNGDARDIVDAARAVKQAEEFVRIRRKPVFLHLRTVRLMGHAGSDLETVYRTRDAIAAGEAQDPLLHTARRLIESGKMFQEDIIALYTRLGEQVFSVMKAACDRPRLTSAKQVMTPIIPPRGRREALPTTPSTDKHANKPQHMSKVISLTLAEQMSARSNTIVFGEDVGLKGGVYGATVNLQQQFGPARVFDTLLDEQTILGTAIGAAHNGFLPIPEIQFLAYVHNAEDQLRGEAATLSFFSNGQYTNPMVIRIAGLGYQKGFGGHFHNDNSLTVFRDIPGVIVACPSNAAEAARLLRESIRLADDEQRVVVFLEPIALYSVKGLHAPDDGVMLACLDDTHEAAPFGEVSVYGEKEPCDIAIVTYGNGAYMARRCARRLEGDGVAVRIIDLRWLSPLPMDSLIESIVGAKSVLIVDECRKTGSIAEEAFTRLTESGIEQPIQRLNSDDSFIPLGPAANAVLISEEQIEQAVKSLVNSPPGKKTRRAS